MNDGGIYIFEYETIWCKILLNRVGDGCSFLFFLLLDRGLDLIFEGVFLISYVIMAYPQIR